MPRTQGPFPAPEVWHEHNQRSKSFACELDPAVEKTLIEADGTFPVGRDAVRSSEGCGMSRSWEGEGVFRPLGLE